MVSGIALALAITAALARGENAPPPPVTISMVAVQATVEHRPAKLFEVGLDQVRGALADLPFDTFRRINQASVSAPFHKETPIDINARYRLHITPLEREPGGHVRVQARIEMAPKDPARPPINAITTTFVIGPGKQCRLGGLRVHHGELVVVISLVR